MQTAAAAMVDFGADVLRRFAPWSGLASDTIEALASSLEPAEHADGDVLIRQGDTHGELHIVVSGRVEVILRQSGDKPISLATLKEGDCFGEMGLLTGDPASADVVSLGPSESLVLRRESFEALVPGHPALLRDLVGVVSQRHRKTGVAVGLARGRRDVLTHFLQEEKSGLYGELIGKQTARAQKMAIDTFAKDAGPVLIQGEGGTGKEALARLIHFGSARRGGPLLSTECSQIGETPLGDKLIGAFGQEDAKSGALHPISYMELAAGGSILLFDIETLPRAVQERLARVLERQAASGGLRPGDEARVIATSKASAEELAEKGQLCPALAAVFAGRTVAVPPLRERKRDIPELAKHFLARAAERLARPAFQVTDEAMTKLVSYDYPGNVRELREAVERAAALSSDALIDPEEIFLGPPPAPSQPLLTLPMAAVRPALRFWPGIARLATAAAFAAILGLCFLGWGPGASLATTLVWSIWWPALVLSFVIAGRAWCALCPMAAAGELAQRLRGLDRRLPAWLKENDAKIAAAGFFAIVWVEEVTGMRTSPLATGLLLLAIGAGAVVTSILYPRRTWCRHLCPLGSLAGVCASSSLIELRPTADICAAKCAGHSCFKGDPKTPGCPMFGHVMFLERNADCVLCLNCVRTCTNGSPRLSLSLPGRELWCGAVDRPFLAHLVAMLLGLLAALVLIQRGDALGSSILRDHRLAAVTAILGIGAALPLLAARTLLGRAARPEKVGAEKSAAGSAGPEEHAAFERRWRRSVALAPLVAGGFIAYQLGHVPGIEAVRAVLSFAPDGAAAASSLSVSALSLLRAGSLAAGLGVTVFVLWKLAGAPEDAGAESRLRRELRTIGGAVSYSALLFAIMSAAW